MSDVIHVFMVPPAPCTCLATGQFHSIYRLKACKTQYKSSIRALPWNQLCCSDIASKRVKRNTKTQYGHSRGTNFVAVTSPQGVQNAIQKLNMGTPVEPTLLQ